MYSDDEGDDAPLIDARHHTPASSSSSSFSSSSSSSSGFVALRPNSSHDGSFDYFYYACRGRLIHFYPLFTLFKYLSACFLCLSFLFSFRWPLLTLSTTFLIIFIACAYVESNYRVYSSIVCPNYDGISATDSNWPQVFEPTSSSTESVQQPPQQQSSTVAAFKHSDEIVCVYRRSDVFPERRGNVAAEEDSLLSQSFLDSSDSSWLSKFQTSSNRSQTNRLWDSKIIPATLEIVRTYDSAPVELLMLPSSSDPIAAIASIRFPFFSALAYAEYTPQRHPPSVVFPWQAVLRNVRLDLKRKRMFFHYHPQLLYDNTVGCAPDERKCIHPFFVSAGFPTDRTKLPENFTTVVKRFPIAYLSHQWLSPSTVITLHFIPTPYFRTDCDSTIDAFALLTDHSPACGRGTDGTNFFHELTEFVFPLLSFSLSAFRFRDFERSSRDWVEEESDSRPKLDWEKAGERLFQFERNGADILDDRFAEPNPEANQFVFLRHQCADAYQPLGVLRSRAKAIFIDDAVEKGGSTQICFNQIAMGIPHRFGFAFSSAATEFSSAESYLREQHLVQRLNRFIDLRFEIPQRVQFQAPHEQALAAPPAQNRNHADDGVETHVERRLRLALLWNVNWLQTQEPNMLSDAEVSVIWNERFRLLKLLQRKFEVTYLPFQPSLSQPADAEQWKNLTHFIRRQDAVLAIDAPVLAALLLSKPNTVFFFLSVDCFHSQSPWLHGDRSLMAVIGRSGGAVTNIYRGKCGCSDAQVRKQEKRGDMEKFVQQMYDDTLHTVESQNRPPTLIATHHYVQRSASAAAANPLNGILKNEEEDLALCLATSQFPQEKKR